MKSAAALLLGQVEVAVGDAAQQDRHAEERAHRRMAGREADRARVLGQVVQAQRLRVADQHAEDAAPARQVADRRVRLRVDAGGDEALELVSRRGRSRRARRSGRPVSSAAVSTRRCEQRVERELRGEGDPRLEEAADAIGHAPTLSVPTRREKRRIPGWPASGPGVLWLRKEEMMMKKIVIATDGSPSSQEAVSVGLELAVEQGAAVAFVHVLPADDYVVSGRLGPVLTKPHRVDMDESEIALREAADAAEAAGVSCTLERISGDTVDEIVAVADSADADLIVIGSRGRVP